MTTWGELVETLRFDLLGALILSVLLGGAVGLERELRGKPAGLRTNILICVGATLFTQLSIFIPGGNGDPGRIAAQIVTGVGFLGAGTILHTRGTVQGLTSAATIWLVAAIGVAVGAGAVFEGAGATLLVLVVLRFLGAVEPMLRRRAIVTHLRVEVDAAPGRAEEVERIVREAGLEIEGVHAEPRGNRLILELDARGPQRLQDQAKLALLRASGAFTLSVDE
ncbi:MAG TPA: MgtC/SapB family protein [Gemmatimonadales bacterium]|nr:MgtC/SapB family protein [Gemmatimonadales bacterium]